ncbi:MAG: hypothetical protein KC560_09705, partial [Myxococcales bacterium]|nr:hypothetical protein [Myxococcales bacterium]
AASRFADDAAFAAAREHAGRIEVLAAEIQRHDDERVAAQALLRDREAAIEGRAEPELTALRAAAAAADEARSAAASAYHRCASTLEALEAVRAKLDASAREQREIDEAYAAVGTLADVASGRNAHNLSLQRFVLSVLLDDVLIEADHRLALMSRSRYRLRRAEGVADGRRKAGLDLEVEDAWTGATRPVSTLSGGESFMAALALALGLSDVVQAYAGGIRLDTLFIDEGFGSLDPESLELAIQALLDLRASGRMVGVISHVAELRERIDVRLEVLASERGSRTRLVVP